MGYTLKIGELEIDYDPEGFDYCGNIMLSARDEYHDDAPAYGEPTDHTNARWPSYRGWEDFVAAVGLKDVFDQVLSSHPGCVLIDFRFKQRVDKAMDDWVARHPEAKAEQAYWGHMPSAYLMRLTWLKYWTDLNFMERRCS